MANTLKFRLVDEMAKKYRTVQLASIHNAPVNPVQNDAHSLWVSLDVLKAFIADIEREVASNTQNQVGNLGVRFYYAAYPGNKVWNDAGYEDLNNLLGDTLTSQYEKRHTLVAIPTFEKSGFHQDFNPADPATYTGTAPAASSSIMAMNHGSMIPPKQSFGEWF